MVELSLNKQKQIIIVDIDEIEFLPSRDDENLVSSHAINFGDESSATLEELQVARFQYEIVRRYLAKEINLKQALEESGLSNGAFYKNIKLYDDLIGAVSLLRAKRGNKKGSSRLLGVVDEIIEKAINEVYRGKSASIAAVWKKVERVCIRLGLKVPSRTAVIARIKKVSEKELYLRKHGHEAASQKHGAKPGRKKVEMPLEGGHHIGGSNYTSTYRQAMVNCSY
jgi:putative transposase